MPRTAKSSVLTLRISPEEQDRLRAAAQAQGVSVSEYLRSRVPDKSISQPAPPVTGAGPRVGTSSAGSISGADGPGAQWVSGLANSQTLSIRVSHPNTA